MYNRVTDPTRCTEFEVCILSDSCLAPPEGWLSRVLKIFDVTGCHPSHCSDDYGNRSLIGCSVISDVEGNSACSGALGGVFKHEIA